MTTTSAPLPLTTDRAAAQARAPGLALLLVILAGTFMVVLDFFIVNVAIPSMQADLHAEHRRDRVGRRRLRPRVRDACLITAGRLGDRFGRRRMFALGMALFTVASAACGMASTPGRSSSPALVQGVAAALLSPQVLSIIGVAYDGDDRVRALSVYGLVMGLAAVGGQLIGGLLIAGRHRRPRVAQLLPHQRAGRRRRAGARPAPDARVRAPSARPDRRPRRGPRHRRPGRRRPAARRGPPARLAAVDVAEPRRRRGRCSARSPPTSAGSRRRGGAPLVDPALFREPRFAPGWPTQLVFWAGQASFFLVLALYLQHGRGLTRSSSGSCSRARGGLPGDLDGRTADLRAGRAPHAERRGADHGWAGC